MTVTYSYGALNRVTQAVTADQTIHYHYDLGANGKGRLSDLTDNSGQTIWSYDPRGRVASRQQSMGGVVKSLSMSYDSAGRAQSLTLPSGHVVQYGYTSGKLASLTLDGSTTILSGVFYEPFGPTRGWTWGNGTLSVRVFDADGKLAALDSAGMKSLSYDNAFRITSVVDSTDPSLSQSYGYDLLDRLTTATGSALNQSFTFDANGNRLTQGGSAVSTYSISSANNRVNSVTGALTKTYSYDAVGNTLNDGANTFTFDQQDRMIAATTAGTTTSYSINALGQRVKKSNLANTTYFMYDEAGHLLGEYDATGALIQELVWLGDIPVASIRVDESGTSVGVFYIHTDHLNTPRKITNPADNSIVWRWDSDPFGNGAPNEDPDGNGKVVNFNLRFGGSYYDAETGLLHMGFRDYSPEIGGFIDSDPIGLWGGSFSTYSYVNNNPISKIDPLGLAEECPTCKQTYLDCLANCIRKYDPLSDTSKIGLTALGGTFPKGWLGLGRGLGGASPVTTVPSAVAYGTGGGAAGTAGAVARGLGRVASPIWIGYGLYLFGMESWCAASCVGNNCAH